MYKKKLFKNNHLRGIFYTVHKASYIRITFIDAFCHQSKFICMNLRQNSAKFRNKNYLRKISKATFAKFHEIKRKEFEIS
jgi:hypothetical protein